MPAQQHQAIQPPDSHAAWRRLYPFESHWLEIAGERLHFLSEGPLEAPQASEDSLSTPPLLFVHGNPTWSFFWRSAILRLRSSYRCVALDQLGCGLSSKPARMMRMSDRTDHLLALLDHLDLRRVTLVGHDWGGAIGLAAALRRPERFGRLVLMNTGAFRPWHIPWRIRVCRAPVLGRLAVQGGNLFCRAALRMTLARKRRLSPEVADGYLATSADWASRRAIYNFVADIPAGPRHPTWDVLADVESNLDRLGELPTLLIWGMKDWCFQPDCLEKFQSIWPRAEVHALSDVGHWVMEDAAEDATEAIAAFLDRTDATRVAEAAARPEDRPMTPQST